MKLATSMTTSLIVIPLKVALLSSFAFLAASTYAETGYERWLRESLDGAWQVDLEMTGTLRDQTPPAEARALHQGSWVVIRVDPAAASEVPDRTAGLTTSIEDATPLLHAYVESWNSNDNEVRFTVVEVLTLPGRLVLRNAALDESPRYDPKFQNLFVIGSSDSENRRLIMVSPGRGLPWGGRQHQALMVSDGARSSLLRPSVLRSDPPAEPMQSMQECLDLIRRLAEAGDWRQVAKLTMHPIMLQEAVAEAEQAGGTEDQLLDEYEDMARMLVTDGLPQLDIEQATIRIRGRMIDFPAGGLLYGQWVWVNERWVLREQPVFVHRFNEARMRRNYPHLFENQPKQ